MAKLFSTTAFCLAALIAMPAVAKAGEPQISTSGSGTVLASPDRAQVDFSIISRAKRSEEASSANAAVSGKVYRKLKEIGFARETVYTVHYGVNTEYGPFVAGKRPEVTGFAAVHRMRVLTGDLRMAGTIIDAVMDAGAAEIDGITFTSSKMDSLRQAALEIAVRNAIGDAGAMARAAGGSLGELIELATPEAQHYFPVESMALKSRSFDEATSIVAQEISVTATVAGRWRFVK